MNLRISILSFLVAILLFSCDEKRVFDEYKSVGSSWHKDSIVSFELPVLDSTKNHDVFLNIRNNNNYPFSNLFLIVSFEKPNGYTKVDTLEYQMAEPDGTLLGEGFTDIKESKLYFKENMKFKGKYRVKIKQAVRESGKVAGIDRLEGITEVGLRIEKKD